MGRFYRIRTMALSALLIFSILLTPAMAEDLSAEVIPLSPQQVEEISQRVYQAVHLDAVNMSISKAGIAYLAAGEGFAPHPVWDYSQWSAGHGSNYKGFQLLFPERFPHDLNGNTAEAKALAETITVTLEEAEAVMVYYLSQNGTYLNSYLTKHNLNLNQNQYDALLIFTYGVGIGWMYNQNSDGTPYKLRVMLETMPSSQWTYDVVEDALIGWSNAGGKPSAGLLNRHKGLARMFTTPYEAPEPEPEPEPKRETIEAFSDVYVDDWYADYVRKVNSRGIMQGMGDGTFNPGGNLTRAQMVKTLANMMKIDESSYRWSDFSDVPLGEWYTPAVSWASYQGIVKGITDDQFAPTQNIQRQHVCSILARFLRLKGVTPGYTQITFQDEMQIQPTALEDVRFCVSLGLVNGLDDGTFAPASAMTRAQAAAVLARMAELMENRGLL